MQHKRVHKIVVNVHMYNVLSNKETQMCLRLQQTKYMFTHTHSHSSSFSHTENKLEAWKAKVLPSMIIIKKYTIVMRISEIGSRNKIRYVIDLLRFI